MRRLALGFARLLLACSLFLQGVTAGAAPTDLSATGSGYTLNLIEADYAVPANASGSRINSCINSLQPAGRSLMSGSSAITEMRFTVVFGAFISLDRSTLAPDVTVQTQIASILASVEQAGLFDRSILERQLEFHIVVSCGGMLTASTDSDDKAPRISAACDKAAHETIDTRLRNLPNVYMSVYAGNAFEWPALHLLWQLARKTPERKFLYFHNKGARHLGVPWKTKGHQRILHEMVLFRETVAPFWSYLELFAAYPDLASAGWLKSNFNFPWINYFWASGHLISSVKEPPKVLDRYHYEITWLLDLEGKQHQRGSLMPRFAVQSRPEVLVKHLVKRNRRVAGKSYCTEECSFDSSFRQREVKDPFNRQTVYLVRDLENFQSSQDRLVRVGGSYLQPSKL